MMLTSEVSEELVRRTLILARSLLVNTGDEDSADMAVSVTNIDDVYVWVRYTGRRGLDEAVLYLNSQRVMTWTRTETYPHVLWVRPDLAQYCLRTLRRNMLLDDLANV